jgi:FkbM family methyltransferase
MIARAPELPRTFRIAAGARRMLGVRGTHALYRSPAMRPLRRLLAAAAPASPQLVEVCGGPLQGARMRIDLSCEKYYWLGTHEEPVQRTLITHAQPGAVAWDIGAHIGFFSLLLARAVGPDGRVLAFEPHAANVGRLTANVTANHVHNVDVLAVALGNASGSAAFAVHRSSLQGALEGPSPSPCTDEIVSVETTTIDDLVRHGAPVPLLIKIDVEGAEGRVLSGGRETIAVHRPVMVIEIHSRDAWDEVLDALPVAYGFKDIDCGHANPRDRSSREPGHYVALPVVAR